MEMVSDEHPVDPVSFFEAKVGREDLLRAVGNLTDLQRTVIGLRFAAALSITDTAKVIGKSENAIKAAQHDALAALRRILIREP